MTAVPPTFSWTSGGLHLEVVLGVILLGAAYARAWRARPGPSSPGSAAAFGGGLLLLLAALNGPLHDAAEYHLFAAHMVQHLVLTLGVAPLLLAGTPGWMLDPLVSAFGRWPTGAVIVRAATRPVPAFALWGAALVAWHLPGPYEAALASHPLHVVQHLTLLAAGVAGWWPVLARSRLAPPLPYAAQILYLFVFGIPMTIVAAMITGAERLLYPFYASAPRVFDLAPLTDQRLGGVIMWVPAGLIPVVAFTIVFFRCDG
jgi:putative membrane protein